MAGTIARGIIKGDLDKPVNSYSMRLLPKVFSRNHMAKSYPVLTRAMARLKTGLMATDTMVKPVKQGLEPTRTTPEPVRTGIRSKITMLDCRDIADLVAKRLTETEACSLLGIEPKIWWSWKTNHKNAAEFTNVLTRVRASQLQAHLANIEDAQYGKNGHRPDWRASDRLLQIKDRERFGVQGHETTVNVSVYAEQSRTLALKSVYGTTSTPIQDKASPKQIGPSST